MRHELCERLYLPTQMELGECLHVHACMRMLAWARVALLIEVTLPTDPLSLAASASDAMGPRQVKRACFNTLMCQTSPTPLTAFATCVICMTCRGEQVTKTAWQQARERPTEAAHSYGSSVL